ncbi:MAG: GumC family protein [Bacteroidia bacterium]
MKKVDQQDVYLIDSFQAKDLSRFIKKIRRHWYWFAITIPMAMGVMLFYGKITQPVYEVNTMLLIDEGDGERSLGQSVFVEGELKLAGGQKNLKNEIGILNSFNLIKEAVRGLDFGVSYYSSKWLGLYRREHYQHFPFKVIVNDSSQQIGGVPFEITILDDKRYRLEMDVEEFGLYNPITLSNRTVESDFKFKGEYAFGETIKHDYFSFKIVKADPAISDSEFEGRALEFALYDLNSLANSYKNRLDIQTIDLEASILEIRSSGTMVQKEIDFLNALNNTYIQTKLEERSEAASSTLTFIENQVNNIRDSLQAAERKLENFRRNNKAIDLNFTAQSALGQLETLESDKAVLQLKDQYYTSLLGNLDDTTSVEQIVAPSGMGVSDPVINDLVIELKRLNSEKLKMSYSAGENSYDMQIIKSQIASTRRSLRKNLQSLSSSTSRGLNANSSRIGRIESTLSRLPGNEKALVEIQRKYTLNENLYNYLQQRLAEVGIVKSEKMAESRILDDPRMKGNDPIAPQKKILLVFGDLIGTLNPMTVLNLQKTQSEFIDSQDHLERLSSVPVIVSIAHQENNKENLIPHESTWQVAESIRDLSANLQFLSPPGNPTVVGFTSTVSGEGKTFTAANLAKSLAESDFKILLIDLDLRKPSLVRYFEPQMKKGLSHYLRGEVDYLNEIIYSFENDQLHFIPTFPMNGGEAQKWINSSRMRNLILNIKEEYDYIILDMPPVGLVSDFLLLSKYINYNFYVVREGYSRIGYINSLNKMVNKGHLENLYVILNDVKHKNFKYGYDSYHYKSPEGANDQTNG